MKRPAPTAEFGSVATGFASGGPFSCMDCVWRTPHSKNQSGKTVDSCSHPLVMKDPTTQKKKLPDGTIEIDADDCCKFVWPTDAPAGAKFVLGED